MGLEPTIHECTFYLFDLMELTWICNPEIVFAAGCSSIITSVLDHKRRNFPGKLPESKE